MEPEEQHTLLTQAREWFSEAAQVSVAMKKSSRVASRKSPFVAN
jgi:hypothetical protein